MHLEIYLLMTRETPGFVKLDVDGDRARTFHQEDVAKAELPRSERSGEFSLLDKFQGPNFHAPGGRDVAVECQQQKVRGFSHPVLLGSRRLEA